MCGLCVVFWICYDASEKAANNNFFILVTSKSHWESQSVNEGFRGNLRSLWM